MAAGPVRTDYFLAMKMTDRANATEAGPARGSIGFRSEDPAKRTIRTVARLLAVTYPWGGWAGVVIGQVPLSYWEC